jgi:hypothetical protein
MHILYVRRSIGKKNIIHKIYHLLLRGLYFRDQDGFFESALASTANVTAVNIEVLPRYAKKRCL